MQNQDFGSKKKLNFGLKNIYKGCTEGAEFKFDGLEMTSERNRKVWFERFENELWKPTSTNQRQNQNFGVRKFDEGENIIFGPKF